MKNKIISDNSSKNSSFLSSTNFWPQIDSHWDSIVSSFIHRKGKNNNFFLNNTGPVFNWHRSFLSDLGCVSGLMDRNVLVYPAGGMDSYTGFGLSPFVDDLVIIGLERFGESQDLVNLGKIIEHMPEKVFPHFMGLGFDCINNMYDSKKISALVPDYTFLSRLDYNVLIKGSSGGANFVKREESNIRELLRIAKTNKANILSDNPIVNQESRELREIPLPEGVHFGYSVLEDPLCYFSADSLDV